MDAHLYKRETYEYVLPEELIAQHPSSHRDGSRLMLIDRESGSITVHPFREIISLLKKGDSLILNNTKVIPARLIGKKETGGSIEFLLFKQMDDAYLWKALAKPAKKIRVGSTIWFSETLSASILEKQEDGVCILRFDTNLPMMEALEEVGTLPLPHYIRRDEIQSVDKKRYQTVYAKNLGACAAPTAGLHFTEELLKELKSNGISHHFVTLHVGLGTFKPVKTDDIRDHKMHTESFYVDDENAKALSEVSSGRKIAVGTTCLRVLESIALSDKSIPSGNGDTNVFIYPGYKFKYVDHLLTNFHLPGSTLMMLVAAFAGHELIMKAYEIAIKEKFRFFSYGDAMLIL